MIYVKSCQANTMVQTPRMITMDNQSGMDDHSDQLNTKNDEYAGD